MSRGLATVARSGARLARLPVNHVTGAQVGQWAEKDEARFRLFGARATPGLASASGPRASGARKVAP